MKKINLTGMRVGKLLVLEEAPESGVGKWLCLCDCGNTAIRCGVVLRGVGRTTSCGCSKKIPNAGHFKAKHGATPKGEITSEKRLYRIWSTMVQRTTNPKAHGFERYGGAGILMCDSWRESFTAFMADMGIPPTDKHTVDRIDPELGYSKENCRWATYTEQNRRRRNTIAVEFEGERWTLGELIDRFGGDYGVIYMRIKRYGWSVSKAFGFE